MYIKELAASDLPTCVLRRINIHVLQPVVMTMVEVGLGRVPVKNGTSLLSKSAQKDPLCKTTIILQPTHLQEHQLVLMHLMMLEEQTLLREGLQETW